MAATANHLAQLAGLGHNLDFSSPLNYQLDNVTVQSDEEDNLLLAAKMNHDFAPHGTLKPLLLKRADWEGWNKPLAPITRRLCYIVPEDAEGESYQLPDRNIEWMESGGRQCAEWSRDNIDPNDVIEKLKNAPLVSRTQNRKKGKGRSAGKKRTNEAKWKNAWSTRAGRWLQDQGGLAVLKVGASREDDIPKEYVEGLLRLPTANLFHGVNAVIEPGSFEMYPSADYHHGIAADPSTKYPLPTPKDVLPSIRRALLEKGRDLGTFLDFLKRNPDRFDHYNLDPETGNRLVDEKDVMIMAVKEKKTTWAMKAAKTRAKTKAANPKTTSDSKKQATLAPAAAKNKKTSRSDNAQQSLPQLQQDLRSRKRSSSDEDSMEPSKKQRIIGPGVHDQEIAHPGPALVPSSYHDARQEAAWENLALGITQVEDRPMPTYHAPLPQYHDTPTPTPVYGDKEQFVNGGLAFASAASTPDSGYDSYPNAELPITASIGGQEVEWYGEGAQADTSETFFNPNSGNLTLAVQEWFAGSVQGRDQELALGDEFELDVVMGYAWWTVPVPAWTQ